MTRGTARLVAALLASASPLAAEAAPDWLIDPSPYRASVQVAADGRALTLSNGLLRRTIRLSPNAATVALDNLMTGASEIRSVRPEAVVEIDGRRFDVGGLVGQPVHNYLLPEWVEGLRADPLAFRLVRHETGKTRERFPWKKHPEWLSRDLPWPPPGVSLTLEFQPPEGAGVEAAVLVHYELYDGIPLLVEVDRGPEPRARAPPPEPVRRRDPRHGRDEQLRGGARPGRVHRGPALPPRRDGLLVRRRHDRAGGGGGVHWKPDPLYATQVNYARQTPCLLETHPEIGPDQVIEPGGTFESFRTFVLLHDSTERERRGLALRRMYRTLAPWSQENPVLMHVRSADPAAVRLAVDQAADVGFELVILTFGSGFDIENEDPSSLARIRELVEYARGKGVALGGYSLLASRKVSEADDVVNPKTGRPGGFATFGDSPCLGSRWGQDYFRKLRQFFERTGAGVLEHDGSYPGDACASTAHPGHRGYDDSQWAQWTEIRDFYRWCRARGIYLNVPDWYFLSGSSKTGMGYRETNWSLPREQQEIVERQNVYDGTWEKTPSMGWMFVPLTEYHGGGAAATIEPLAEHLAHYETRLANLFGAGVQACYRGPRLYDTEATRAVVRKWVGFYKAHRAILDSDVVHLRRPDGRDWDGLLHVNPGQPTRGLAVIHNPLDVDIERDIRLPLYYTGLTEAALVRGEDGAVRRVALERDHGITTRVKVPARGRTWLTIEAP